MYWMPLVIGVETTLTFPACLSSAKSLFGRSNEMSASPRSISARRLPADGNHAPDDATHLRQRAGFPGVVALEHDLGAGLPARDLVSAAARRVGLGVFERPRILFVGLLLQKLGVVDRRHHHGDVRHRQIVLADQVDPERVIVDGDELLGLLQRARFHLEGREAADRDRAVIGPLHVLGRDRRAVVEGRVLAQLEGDRGRRDVPVLGQFRRVLVAVVGLHTVRQRLDRVRDQPVVAVPGHLIAGPVGADAVHIEIVRAAFAERQQRLLARLRLGLRPDRRCRHAAGNGRGGFQEVAPFHWNVPRCCERARVSSAKVVPIGATAAGFAKRLIPCQLSCGGRKASKTGDSRGARRIAYNRRIDA